MFRTALFVVFLMIILIAGCDYSIDRIWLVNDTDSEIQIVYYNVTVAAIENVIIEARGRISISLKGLPNQSSIEKIRQYLKENLVIKTIKNNSIKKAFSGDEYARRIIESIGKENDELVIRMSSVLKPFQAPQSQANNFFFLKKAFFDPQYDKLFSICSEDSSNL